MRVVANIPDELYEYLKPHRSRSMSDKKAAELFLLLHKAVVVDGVPLPKGHGRLIDADALEYTLGASDRDIYVKCCLDEEAPTIIGADKEGE